MTEQGFVEMSTWSEDWSLDYKEKIMKVQTQVSYQSGRSLLDHSRSIWVGILYRWFTGLHLCD